MTREEYIGKRFGKLVVESVDTDLTEKRKDTYFICRCDCGNITSVAGYNLHNNHTKSCGCLKREAIRKHGLSKTRIGKIYKEMLRRCNVPHAAGYSDYGGRGIRVCNEWLNDIHSFYKWAMENGYDDTLSIDRIDVNGNYEPANCRWADRKTQSNNRRINNHVWLEGKRYTVTELARELGVSINTIYRYFDTEREIKKDKLFCCGKNKTYIPRKTKEDILRAAGKG